MSFSLTQLLSHAKARPIILLPVALLVVAVVGHLIFSKPSKERLIKNLNSQLREEKFEQLYEEADDSVRLNVTKERFVKRMKMTVTKLKTIDQDLNFQRDTSMENGFLGDDLLIRSVQELEKGDKSVSMLVHWDVDGKFFDMSVLPNSGTSEEFRVIGVSAKSYSVGNQVLDW
jgi:hypothetical protein